MIFDWNNQKNQWLKSNRNISFEQVVVAIEGTGLLDTLVHPNQDKYTNQILILVRIMEYVYAVPAKVDKHKYFLKTIYPSRKYTKIYLGGRDEKAKNG